MKTMIPLQDLKSLIKKEEDLDHDQKVVGTKRKEILPQNHRKNVMTTKTTRHQEIEELLALQEDKLMIGVHMMQDVESLVLLNAEDKIHHLQNNKDIDVQTCLPKDHNTNLLLVKGDAMIHPQGLVGI